jgi:hypothetical protein
MQLRETGAGGLDVEAVLQDGLARGDALVGGLAPVLRYLVANDAPGLFGEDILARVRAMLADLARQLLETLAATEGEAIAPDDLEPALQTLGAAFLAQPALLAHVHALALEWQLTERLQARLALDPVVSPLLQALIGSEDAATAAAAMALLAAQARFGQAQRRMELPVGELPAEVLGAALAALRAVVAPEDDGHALAAANAIRAAHDESRGRLALAARLITGMGPAYTAALSVQHAGAALFLTALAQALGVARDAAVLVTNEAQAARLALGLRAAGLRSAGVHEQFASLYPDGELPGGFDTLGQDRAASLLGRRGG